MLAAILLQNGAVPLHSAAAVSIIRCHNTGPWLLLDKMRTDWHYGSLLVGFLAALLTLTTLSLQFTSTVLLSQVGIASLPVAASVSQTYYSADIEGPSYISQREASPSFLKTTPVRYPAFAEWTFNATGTTSQDGEFAPNSTTGVRDTGTVIRAFLPFKEDDERRSLIEYHGYATAVDTRVVCMRPKLTNVFFNSGEGYRVTGLADIKKEPLGLLRKPNDEGSTNYSMEFDCGFSVLSRILPQKMWPVSLCELSQMNSRQGIHSVMEPEGKEELGESYLLINATRTETVTDLDDSDVWVSMTLEDSYSFDGGSGDEEEEDEKESMTIQFTLCMTAFEAQEMEIDATRPVSFPPEPTILWDTSTASYDIRDVQRQLGAGISRGSTTDRGIFDLAPRSWKRPNRSEFLSADTSAFSTTDGLDAIGLDDMYRSELNAAQYSVLAYIATYTADPSLALQAYFTTLCALCYYDRIIMFDKAAPSSRISLVQVTRPLSWTAFIIVAGVAVLHLLLVLLVIFIFCRSGSLSRIENAWPCISQLLGPTTEGWIRDADMVDDETVKSWLKDRGMHETLVRVENVQNRVQLVEKDKVL
ncbi:hypothetical protein FOXYS1_15801 [Fusarium oxysporum]|uniref:Uncharacterized protein n=1 Tax=Fusarium oxysporum TaxID=5507 RepID=A0A8H4YQF9_FUSOX|nr:hypothetical protein FOXYS1_15801 [Fusarium oxysporum]